MSIDQTKCIHFYLKKWEKPLGSCMTNAMSIHAVFNGLCYFTHENEVFMPKTKGPLHHKPHQNNKNRLFYGKPVMKYPGSLA